MSILNPKPVNFIYQLEGDIQGVDLKDLSPILLSLGELIQEANAIINPGGRELSIKVKPFQKGSFLVEMLAFAQTNAQQLIDLVSNENTRSVKEVLEWIGIIVGGTGGLIYAIKWLKGKPKSIQRADEGEYIFINQNDESKTFSSITYALFSNTKIQANIFNVFGKPNKIEGVTGISTLLKEEEKTTSQVEITYNETKYFSQYEHPYEVHDSEETVNETEMIVFLNPQRGSYQGDKGPYTFVVASSNDALSRVSITDEDFKQKLISGEIRLHVKDLIKARISIKQKHRNGEIQSPSYEIVEVLDYQKHSRISQSSLEL